jgi:hypothetical protein
VRRRPGFTIEARIAGALLLAAIAAPAVFWLLDDSEPDGGARPAEMTIYWSEGPTLIERREGP